jgi:4-carboxymuconolactone decarboxylase
MWMTVDEPSLRHHLRAGDVVRIPPNTRHWHGAAPTTAMTHIAIQESLNGKAVEWLEKVTDANT